jgi:penicillin-binding protein 1C
MTPARGLFFTVALLFCGAVARDQLDVWVGRTVLPDLTTETSVEVVDREGALLRAYTVEDGRWRMATQLVAVDAQYIEMLVRYEDKRFYDHAGVDPRAILRAVGQAMWSGEVVSGGSTLTMQVARLLEDSGTGRMRGKLRQMRLALALERELTKGEILTLYLNRAPFGGNIEGVRAASWLYFGKEPRRLTPAQAALLVALPQSPERRRPDRYLETAYDARDRVLARLGTEGILDAEQITAARTELIANSLARFPALAPHLSDRIIAQEPTLLRHNLTLSAAIQAQIEMLATQALEGRDARMSVAILVADHTTGEVLAQVGSARYDSDARQGFVDMTRALRSPGSTLKPLIYGLAFDAGLAHPETMISDTPVNFDGYAPQNFDGQFRGDLRVRTALQTSLNIPTVLLTDALGPQHLIAGLRRAGADPVVPGGQAGLAVVLGGVGLTLEDLVLLYAGIANNGQSVDLHATGEATEASVQILSPVGAWYVTDILRDVPRPRGVLGDGIAFKTGTSYGHRDAWAVGYDGRHVIGVWMGRADGTPVPGAFGGELAAPVMFQAFSRLGVSVTPLPAPPAAALISSTSNLPQPLQRFRPRGAVFAQATGGPRIAFPPDGSIVETQGGLVVKLTEGRPPFVVLADGTPILNTHAREVVIPGLGRGFTALSVVDAQGRTAAVQIELR